MHLIFKLIFESEQADFLIFIIFLMMDSLSSSSKSTPGKRNLSRYYDEFY